LLSSAFLLPRDVATIPRRASDVIVMEARASDRETIEAIRLFRFVRRD
jgi:hypothetical protein